MAPSEMADWLEQFMEGQWERDLLLPGEAGRLTEIAAYLRRQPTDAQKIEALDEAAEAGYYTGIAGLYNPNPANARTSARYVRRAMRLLGIDPEAP